MSEFSLGWVLVTTVEDKIRSIDLAESKDELWSFLSNLSGCRQGTSSIKHIVKYLNNEEITLNNVEVSGTDFQKNVWLEIQKIPKGETRTYQEVADRLGKISAVRAVASAIAANQLAVWIPCHRIVPKVGGVGKFRWGTNLKNKLLKREKDEHKII